MFFMIINLPGLFPGHLGDMKTFEAQRGTRKLSADQKCHDCPSIVRNLNTVSDSKFIQNQNRKHRSILTLSD